MKVESKLIQVKLPDGSTKEYPGGITAMDVAKDIGPGLAGAAIAAKVDGELVDLSSAISSDADLEIITADSDTGLAVLRHSAAHIMAQAVKRLYPNAKLGIGPSIENGFYYDFDLPEPLSSDDLSRIEEEMKRIVEEDLPFFREEVSPEEARKLFSSAGEKYKVELLEDIEDEAPSLYRQGEFVDLCRGPHIPSTGRLKAFKLLSVAGAYWRGDSRNQMLQRIYGTAFAKKDQLKDYLRMLEEAARRDHRKIGKELDLFSIQEEGPGFPFFHPKGVVIRRVLEEFWRREHRKRGYVEIQTPVILSESLWRQSGHWDHYRENMYFTQIDDSSFAIKPMNCPGAVLVYKTKLRSYRDLPLRMGELGLVHRHELSGVLHGLMRVRCFTQDDAHIFMLPSQISREVQGVIDLTDYFYRQVFGFDYHVELSTRPENSAGSDEIWEKATSALKEALDAKGISYKINEGDGAFYGPKIDFHLKDSIGRTWQCGTIQLDFVMPERFDLTYMGEDGERYRPVMIHRVVFGSIERFIGILIEHYAGAFPIWLAPVQVKVITVSEKNLGYAGEVKEYLENLDIRTEINAKDEKVGYKIREAQLEQVPYMLVVGDTEAENKTVSVRHRRKGDLGSYSLEEFAKKAIFEIESKLRDE